MKLTSFIVIVTFWAFGLAALSAPVMADTPAPKAEEKKDEKKCECAKPEDKKKCECKHCKGDKDAKCTCKKEEAKKDEPKK